MICEYCGRENPQRSGNCISCGAPLEYSVKSTPPAPPPPEKEQLATASLVLGLSSLGCLITAIPGLITGILALQRINRSQGRLTGKGMTTVGLVMSGVMLLVLPVVLIFGTVLFPVFGKARGLARMSACTSSAKQLSYAALMYASDWDGHLPLANSWSDDLLPYVEDIHAMGCADAPRLKSAFAYNRNLSGKNLNEITNRGNLVMFFESDRDWNGSGDIGAVLQTPRHRDRVTAAFADGSMKMSTSRELANREWMPVMAPPTPQSSPKSSH